MSDSLNALQGEVIAPVQDALHRAFTHPCEMLRLEGHSGRISAIAFSPGGDRIVSGGEDGTLRLWPGGRWPDWLHTCCGRLMRHPRFTQPTSDSDLEACQVCQDYVWTEAELAEFRQAQAIAQGGG